ncbi:MAG: methyltransferase domain-containing protein [Gammaproteobacteria bacterium]|nr:methyltransferase domain-containing protein [Gammaproteobacteria bacterium]MDH5650474.1 methyltransferase domain-containing protein [Gammaproteobacteria bacterium]
MTQTDQLKWDQRYRLNEEPPVAARVLTENLHLLPAQGTALDFACGLGGNALLLAREGLETLAWDISPVAIVKLQQTADDQQLPVTAEVRDVMKHPLPEQHFDVIVVSYFLERSLAPALQKALKPNGLLFYQTFNQTRLTGRGPQNPDYRLAENELPALFAGLKIRYYREDGLTGELTSGLRDESLLVAQNC